MEKSKIVYLDNASATPMEERVISVMQEIFKEYFANPSAIHALGVKTERVLEEARNDVAQILGARPNEIIFTSGATENNNLAILGILENFKLERDEAQEPDDTSGLNG